MVPKPDAVTASTTLPAKVDVVVIGGGIIGVTASLFLARKGLSVALCEKGHIAGEQSGRNWGWVRVMGRDKREIPLALESQRLWAELSAEPGIETGFRRAGIVYLYDTKHMRDTYSQWAAHGRDYQLTSRELDRTELKSLVPGLAAHVEGALYTPSDARAEPQKAAPAFAELARRAGASIHTQCAVRGIETKGGRISGVVTERGRISASAVLLAGGAWSRLFCGNLGLDLPQLNVLGAVLRTDEVEGGPDVTLGASNYAARKRLDGGYSVARRNYSVAELTPDSFRLFFDYLPAWSREWRDLKVRLGKRWGEEWRTRRRWSLDEETPFEHVRLLDPDPKQAVSLSGLENLRRALPAFRTAKVLDVWGGAIDVTPDGVPTISPVAAIPGFYLATGFSGHGFGIGPGAGRLAADIVAGDRPFLDVEPYSLDRFVRTKRSIGRLHAG